MCIKSKLRILNGRILSDSLGYNTYFGPRGSSTIDYIVVSENLFDLFNFINVRPPNELSDHCVIWCGMKTTVSYSEINDEFATVYATLPGKFIVDESTKQMYVESLLDNESYCLIQSFLNDVENNDIDIETLTNQFAEIINTSVQKSAKFKLYSSHKRKKRLKKKWFDNNCYIMKRELRKLGKRLLMNSNNADLKCALKKEYNKTLKMTKRSIYKRILKSGTFPHSWNISLVSFIAKNNEIYDCNNYRCLSLTSCFGKLFTSLLQTRLHNYMENNNLYNRFQAGFRPGHRTTDHIYTIKTIINKYIFKCKKRIYACFVDFSKAFDTVWRSGLFQKLRTLGIGGNFYNVVKYMHSNSKFVVKMDNFLSHLGQYERGVRQGDGLSPLLFNIFLNDINDIFDETISQPVILNTTKLNCLIYADDVFLLSESKEGLQSCLDSLNVYCDYWKLRINTEKTKVMVFSAGKIKTDNIKFTLNKSDIEIVDNYKYLGILLSYNGNFKHAADHMYQKSLKAIFSLKSSVLDFESTSNTLKLKLFDTLIRPILTYGAEIWIGDYNIKEKTLDTLPFEKKNTIGFAKTC